MLDFIRNSVKAPEEFTRADVDSALECYDKRYCKFPLNDISKLSGILIARNRRNGRSQKMHLKIARFSQSLIYEEKGVSWRGTGRVPGVSKNKDIIEAWQQEHPDTKQEIVLRQQV